MLPLSMHLPFLYEQQLTGQPSPACLPPGGSALGWCLCRSSSAPSLHARASMLLGTRVNSLAGEHKGGKDPEVREACGFRTHGQESFVLRFLPAG